MAEERKLQPINTSPDRIPDHIFDELICRFLINLPESERQPPRIFQNIKEACWFYADNFCSIPPKANNKFEKSFAKKICNRWKDLHYLLADFDKQWEHYRSYKVMIPSFGAVMLSKKFQKILFVVYQSERDENINMLDFPKGKADEGEPDIECAVREITEEIGFNIRPFINENQYIKIETIRNKFVKLYLVKDVDDSNTAIKPQRRTEVQKIEWIDTKFYMQQSLLSGMEKQQKYNWQYVQPFAYYILHWINYQQTYQSMGSIEDQLTYQKILPLDQFESQQYPIQQLMQKFEELKKDYLFKYDWKDMKYFIAGLYFQHLTSNQKKAREYYKKAIRRSENPRSAFNMLISIYITECPEIATLRKKIDKLVKKFGNYMQFDRQYQETMRRLHNYMSNQEREQLLSSKRTQADTKQLIMIVSLKQLDIKIRNTDDEYEKIRTLIIAGQQLKFDPFILKMKIVLQLIEKRGQYQSIIKRYLTNAPLGFKPNQYNDFVLVECASEAEAQGILEYTENQQAFICSKSDILIDGGQYQEGIQQIQSAKKNVNSVHIQFFVKMEKIYKSNMMSGFQAIQNFIKPEEEEEVEVKVEEAEAEADQQSEEEIIQETGKDLVEEEEQEIIVEGEPIIIKQQSPQKPIRLPLQQQQPKVPFVVDKEEFANSIVENLRKYFDPKAYCSIQMPVLKGK